MSGGQSRSSSPPNSISMSELKSEIDRVESEKIVPLGSDIDQTPDQIQSLVENPVDSVASDRDRIASSDTNVMNGDQIDQSKAKMDRLKSEIKPRCDEIDQIASVDVPASSNDTREGRRLVSRAVKLNEEVHELAKEAYRFALEMKDLCDGILDDPRASLIREMTQVALKSLKVSKDALELVRKIEKQMKRAHRERKRAPNVPLTALMAANHSAITEMQLETGRLSDRRNDQVAKYDELSAEYDRIVAKMNEPRD